LEEEAMAAKTRRLRELIASSEFLYMPSAATPLKGRIAEAAGTLLVYTGGYVTGASRAITEPLLTMDEQVRVAGEVARAISVPLVADAGAGFGEPMRTVREFAAAGVAGIHIEDQLYPKRAHYHGYQVHAIPLGDFVAKIRYACRQRDESDPDFVIIARSDTCREFGLDEAIFGSTRRPRSAPIWGSCSRATATRRRPRRASLPSRSSGCRAAATATGARSSRSAN
jgi:methylisocitrate lyase